MNALIAVAQMCSGSDIDANFATVERLCVLAKNRGAIFVSFPENFAYLPKHTSDSVAMAEALDGPLFSRYRALAKRFGLEISFGGFPERGSGSKILNTHTIVSNSGEIIAAYRKIHLFALDLPDGTQFDESVHYEAGADVVMADASFAKLGLSICYDLRFAELYRALAQQGAELLLAPSSFTAVTGKAHWEVLLRARSIENQCYVAAAAQFGTHHPGRTTHGHAMIVDPWGTVVAQCSDQEGLAFAEVDHAYLKQVRAQIPMAAHRRPDLFS
jgi:predicted amidohydrolase